GATASQRFSESWATGPRRSAPAVSGTSAASVASAAGSGRGQRPRDPYRRRPDARFAVPVEGNRHTLRWVMAHMTSETARHAGHADISGTNLTAPPVGEPLARAVERSDASLAS